MTGSLDALARTVRIAARALARAGLVHAYGHCSTRVGAAQCLVAPPKPLGLVGVGEPCDLLELDGALPERILGEVRVHRAIYRMRPDVGGIVRCMPPSVMVLAAYGISPRARHGFGSYFHPAPPLWDDPQLLRTEAQAVAAAQLLGTQRAILLRGNGAVVAGATLEEAVVLAWYLEDMARVELAGLGAGLKDVPPMSAEAARERATWSGAILERMWKALTHSDPECAPSPEHASPIATSR